MGSEEREVEDGMEEPFETEEVKDEGEEQELANEAEVEQEETTIESQNLEDPASSPNEPVRPVAVSSQPPSTPANIADIANTANMSRYPELTPATNIQVTENTALESASTYSPVTVSSHQEKDVTANTSMPPEQPQELAEGPISDTETVYPEEDNLEPYVFNWEENVFIDASGHLDTWQRFQDANFDPNKQYLQRCHWEGVTEAYKPKQVITHYPGPADSSGHQPSLPVPELTVTTPEGDTFWLDDPLPWNRLCMNRRWLSQNFIDENGHLDTWKRVADEEQREQVARGQRRLQNDNWVLSKFAPLDKKPEGVPEITVTVPGGNTFYLDEPRSWADLDDDDDDDW
ncbi:hypothetical protein N0V85_004551 [Neurospora sp. IMI 360204]|nr:hypothetical protein N0V85_004551 [Neurospora sp. IMI 360204]